MSLAFIKNQDFYLRLGFLKVLVVLLSPQRRSLQNDLIIRRLERPLFMPLSERSLTERWQDVDEVAPSHVGELPKAGPNASVAEALLIKANAPSLLFAVTAPTAYKILDWGHDIELVGRANQITERGLLFRSLIDVARAEAFVAGDAMAWNPFALSRRERLFMLFHLGSIDRVTLRILDEVGALPAGTVLESNDAAKITCRAMHHVLAQAREGLPPSAIPSFRTASELANTIARELGLVELVDTNAAPARRPPRPVRPGTRPSSFLNKSSPRRRTSTKNADHQTIPRFEQLVDIGLLAKPDDRGGDGRRRWRYATSDATVRWRGSAQGRDDGAFLARGFAASAVAALGRESPRESITASLIAKYLWHAYQAVHRSVGHTPLDSVAVYAMILAADDGQALELSDFHRLMLTVKESNMFADIVFFASGNALDKMFILVRPGFLERVAAHAEVFSHVGGAADGE